MELSELQTAVNYRRRDITESFISNDEITSYLNEALRKTNAEHEWDFTKTSTTFTYTNGSQLYAISAIASDHKYPVDVFYNDDYEIEMVSPEDFRRLSASTSYDIYAVDGSSMYVDTSFGSATLQYHYYSTHMAKTSGGSWQAALSSSTDTPIIPVRWQDMLVDFAAARCFQKEGMLDDYTIAYSDFRKSLDKMRIEFPSRRRVTIKRWMHSTEVGAKRGVYAHKSDPLRTA